MKSNRQGVGFVEILLAVVMLGVLTVPLLQNMGVAVKETAVSQDYMLAEAIAQSALAEVMAIPLEDIRSDLPYFQPIGLQDGPDQKRLKDLAIYRAALDPKTGMRGQVVVEELDRDGNLARRAPDGPGLLRYVVTLEWPVHPGSSQVRNYTLLRLRCPSDVSLHVRYPDDEGPHKAAIKGGS